MSAEMRKSIIDLLRAMEGVSRLLKALLEAQKLA